MKIGGTWDIIQSRLELEYMFPGEWGGSVGLAKIVNQPLANGYYINSDSQENISSQMH